MSSSISYRPILAPIARQNQPTNETEGVSSIQIMSSDNSAKINVVDYSEDEIKKAHEVLYNEGLRMRIQVAGEDYVKKSLNAAQDPFAKSMQEVCMRVSISVDPRNLRALLTNDVPL